MFSHTTTSSNGGLYSGFAHICSRSRNFWVASPSSLSPIANFVHPYPLVKSFMFRYIPLAAFPKPPTVAYLMKINAVDGALMTSIVDSKHPIVKSATDVYEKNGMLYISSVKGSFVATIPAPKPN